MTKKECMLRLVGDAQKAVFRLLWNKKTMRAKDIIAHTDIQSGTVNKAIQSLITKGFVERVDYGLYRISDTVTK